MSFSLAGKVAIITGGASGIGLATAQAFLNAGVQGLTVVDLSPTSLDTALATFSTSDQAKVLLIKADVSKEDEVENYVTKTVERFGQLDISVQNAGMTQKPVSVLDQDVDQFMKVLDVNVKGPFLGVKFSVRAMLASPSCGKGCSIIITGSQLGLDGVAEMPAYSSSKFAVRGLVLSAAAELGPRGIRVNNLAPGPIVTPMMDHTPKEWLPALAGKAMLGRLGEAEEIAKAMLFLASDASSYVTGATIKRVQRVENGVAKAIEGEKERLNAAEEVEQVKGSYQW